MEKQVKSNGGANIPPTENSGLTRDDINNMHERKLRLSEQSAGSRRRSAADRESDVFSEMSEDDVNQNFFHNIGREVLWTDEDRMTLQSIDELHTRLLEYHNNVHARSSPDGVKEEPGSFGARQGLSLFNKSLHLNTLNPLTNSGDEVAITYVKFISELKVIPPIEVPMRTFQSFVKDDIDHILYEMEQKKEGLLWIRVHDPSTLSDLAINLNMHELCASGFSDLRAFSSFIPVADALFCSFCNFVLSGHKINMYKLFVYVGKNVVVTYEREIMPDLLDSLDKKMQTECTTPMVMKRYNRIGKHCAQMGGIYLITCLALQSLASQDTLIDFFSRNLFFFRQKVTTRQYHKEKLIIARQMHTVGVAVIMIKKTVSHNEETFVRLLSAAMSGVFVDTPDGTGGAGKGAGPGGQDLVIMPRIPLLAPMHLLMPEHTPYLLDLVDSYKFSAHLLGTEIEEVQALTGAMDALTTLRSINTSTLLSFVATIFLPLNFLTGVFGTNFVDPENDEYYMKVLNDPRGPVFFEIMCIMSFMLVCVYFVYNGWVDMRINWKNLLSFVTCGFVNVHDSDAVTRRDTGRATGNARTSTK